MSNGYRSNGSIDTEWWIRQVEEGKRWRDELLSRSEWTTWRKAMRGEWPPGILPSNLYFKMIRTLVPRIYYRNPSVSITPSKPGLEFMLLAKIYERMDNKLLDMMGVKRAMKTMVLHGLMFGNGVGRLGYGSEFAPTPEELSTEGPDAGGLRRRNNLEYNSFVHANRPWFLPAHPGNIVFPKGCPDFASARWICYETWRPKEDILDDPRLLNKRSLQDDEPDGIKAGAQKGSRMTPSEKDRAKSNTTLWEIRDKKSGLVFVMSPYANPSQEFGRRTKVMYQEEDLLQRKNRLPAYMLTFNQDDEYLWGIPVSKILWPQQKEKNEIRTMMMYHRRTAIVKLLYETGSVTPDELTKIMDGNVNIAVQLKNINGVKVLEPGQMPQTLLETDALADREVQELLGLGVNQFGEYAPGSADRSATEANIVNQATNIRSDEFRDSCADLLVELVDDINSLITDQWTAEQVIDIVGPGGAQIWLSFRPSELKALQDYNIKIDPDSALPETKQLREQRAANAYQLLGQDQAVNHVNLLRWALSESGLDSDFLLQQPVMQTTPQQPMSVGQAAQGLQRIGQQQPQALRGPQGRAA